MLAYSIIMFLAAALFSTFSVAIYKGRTDLIHAYHQAKVRNKAAYGRAFGKALSCFALAMALSGLVGLFADTKPLGMAAIAILIAGLCIGVVLIVAVQRKYNKGVF